MRHRVSSEAVMRLLFPLESGAPDRVTAFARDEGEHHQMRVDFGHGRTATADIAHEEGGRLPRFCLGDVRDCTSVLEAVPNADVLEEVPFCGYFSEEALRSNMDSVLNAEGVYRELGTTSFLYDIMPSGPQP